MASEQRIARLREEIKRDAGDIIHKMKDPRLGFVTVTDVEVTRDLRYATIYVSIYGEPDTVRRSLAALTSGTGHVRSELGKRLKLRHTPELAFKVDESAQRGAAIDALIAKLHEND
ncbi:MAG TPA: 30S ribosome-binding factor RbfA [Firmicutes bacterium]|jgi:ribosome-binding factor A|nr:30S ribosome-binding factor RbfA [Bacillota bacterium]